MLCVIYASVAEEGTSEENVADIVEQAEAANSRAGITGALVFDGKRFCQLLEGDEQAVMATLERIYGDTRHRDIDVIGSSPATERRFPGWAMLRIDDSEFQTILTAMKG